jgi:hypothetical protein
VLTHDILADAPPSVASVDTSRRTRLVQALFHAGLTRPQSWPDSVSTRTEGLAPRLQATATTLSRTCGLGVPPRGRSTHLTVPCATAVGPHASPPDGRRQAIVPPTQRRRGGAVDRGSYGPPPPGRRWFIAWGRIDQDRGSTLPAPHPPTQRTHGLWKVAGLRKPRTKRGPPASLPPPARGPRSAVPAAPWKPAPGPPKRPPSCPHPRRFHTPPTAPTTTTPYLVGERSKLLPGDGSRVHAGNGSRCERVGERNSTLSA